MNPSIVQKRSLILRSYAEALSQVGKPHSWSRPPLPHQIAAAEQDLEQALKGLQSPSATGERDGASAANLQHALDLVATAAFLNWQNQQRARAIELLEQGLRLDPQDPFSLHYILLGILLEGSRAAERGRAQIVLDTFAAQGEGIDWRSTYYRSLLAYQRHGDTLESRALIHQSLESNRYVSAFMRVGRERPGQPTPDLSSADAATADAVEAAVQYAVVALPAWEATPGALDWLASREDLADAPDAETNPARARSLAMRTWGMGSIAERLANVQQVLQLDPESPEGHIQQGELIEQEGADLRQAWTQYTLAGETISGRYPRDNPSRHDTILLGRALRGAGRMAWAFGDRIPAIASFENAYRCRTYEVSDRPDTPPEGRRADVACDQSFSLQAELHRITCLMESGERSQWVSADRLARNGWVAKLAEMDCTYFQALFIVARRSSGNGNHARALLRKAIGLNPYVPEYLLMPRRLPAQAPIDYDPGDRADAIRYALYARDVWKQTNGALVWLLREMDDWGWALPAKADA